MAQNMTGAELASMKKSSVHFKSNDGVVCEALRLGDADKKWWMDAKIGMFFHWGLYSVLGRGEWAMFNEKIPYEEYKKLADAFKPDNFDMHELTGLAKAFGAKYMVMVARHHDGFALWDSQSSFDNYTSYATAAGRDFVDEYTRACREAGLAVGLYYSPMDWRFPGYFDPVGLPENAALLKRQGYGQVKELCNKYGKIDILWYDGGWLAHNGTDADAAWFWEPVKLNQMARESNPKMLINPRSGWEGDFQCDEGPHKIKGPIISLPWEKNMSVTGSWAWRPDDASLSADELIEMLVNVVCRGGNLLLNVGPDVNGKVSPDAVSALQGLGSWLAQYGDSIYETRAGCFEPVDDVYGSTQKDHVVYLHILDADAFQKITLPAPPAPVCRCETHAGMTCAFTQDGNGLKISLPDTRPDERVLVLRLLMA